MAQEGWHYELEDATKPEDMVFKGVVYNEMKGVYSSPDSLLGRAIQTHLFPDVTYGVDSGGDPVEIRKLTFEQFKEFHDSYYRKVYIQATKTIIQARHVAYDFLVRFFPFLDPANSRIFFYGDDPVDERLQILDEYLGQFEPLPGAKERSVVQWQQRLSEPRSEVCYYPADEEQVSWQLARVGS